jgi:4-oxalocrotonate tautomerase
MPIVNVKVIENVFTPEQKQAMIRGVTNAMIAVEGEGLREYTLVLIEEVKEGDWAVGGRCLKAEDVHRIQNAA